MSRLTKWVQGFFGSREGDKFTLKMGPLLAFGAAMTLLGAATVFLTSDSDQSVYRRSTHPPPKNTTQDATPNQPVENLSAAITTTPPNEKMGGHSSERRKEHIEIKYSANQVIERGDKPPPPLTIPRGSKFIGRLVTGIDTNHVQTYYEIDLPHGAWLKTGAEIPPGTVLLAKLVYPTGERVFLNIERGILSDGREFPIRGEVLNSKDFTPGIVGHHHGKAGMRLIGALGLTLASGVAEAMTERETVDGSETVTTPKQTIENGLYHGAAKAAGAEASRQMKEIGSAKEYVTVEPGTTLIVNISSPLYDDPAKHTP